MNINWDIEKLDSILQDFTYSCGINISIVNKDFKSLGLRPRLVNEYCQEIQKLDIGKNLCIHSDEMLFKKCSISKKTEIHVCHAGLIDVAVPIIWNEELLGYIILGQMKKENDFMKACKKISHLPIDMHKMENLYEKLPLFDEKKIQSISNIATMVSKYILLEKIFKLETNNVIEIATNFIHNNLDKNISIQNIVDSTGISKSVLYKNFYKKFNCSPGEYIKKKRINKSIEYLKNTDLSIEGISQLVGFSDMSYFSKVFKKEKGISPLKFRKSIT